VILTPDDKAIFFPSIQLEENALLGFLVRAQAIAESPLGANRPLELQEHIFHIEIPASLFYLPNTPIALDPIPVIEQRVTSNPYPHTFGYGRQNCGLYPYSRGGGLYPLGLTRARGNMGGLVTQDIAPVGFGRDGRLIPVTQYEIESESGRVELNHWAIATSLKVVYTGGYDFSIPSPVVLAIKSAVAAILKQLLYADGLIGGVGASSGEATQGGLGEGLPIEIDVIDDIRVKYSDPGSGGNQGAISRAYDNALAYLRSFNKRRTYAH